MRARCRFWVIGLGLLGGAGCAVVEQGVHVVSYKIDQRLQDFKERQRNRKWAAEAWRSVCQADPRLAQSHDYETGFKDGFEEYVWRGGDGEPPPLPPIKYRAIRYQTPSGYQAIESWFAGYRHGARAAQEGGYRDLVTGPSSLTSVSPDTAEGVYSLPLVEAHSAAAGVYSLPLVETHSAAEGKVLAPSSPSRAAQPLEAASALPPLVQARSAAEGKVHTPPSPSRTAQPLEAASALPPPSPAAEPTIRIDQRTDLATRWDWLDPRPSRPVGRPVQASAPPPPSPAAEPTIRVDQRADLATRWDWLDPRPSRPVGRPGQASTPGPAPEQSIPSPTTPSVRLVPTSASGDEGPVRNADGK